MNTTVISHPTSYLLDEKHWEKPQEFNPNRFLNGHGQYISNNPAFVPFGVGRRICPGETMAFANLLLILVRFLQLTHNYKIEIEGNNSLNILDPDLKQPLLQQTKQFKISLVSCEDEILA